jgi:peptidoglycan/LPS O-acetylase OafA/YrhL
MRYLPAIDGLRAIAVILVLLFHAKVPLFSGGYVGVDVFFVISGYLITRLIQHELAAGRFTLLGFYERRIRRIFPALFLVVLATAAIAALLMLPPDLARLGSSVAASALFVANFYFWAQRLNYLQDWPDLEPLLHTWSLSIEEQFYLLFPIFMLVALRFFRRLDLAFLIVALASLALSVLLSTTFPRAAFYASPSRAWELLLGAWLAVTSVKDAIPRRVVPALQWAGIILIAAAAVGYDRLTPFPGLAALVPCAGAALLIAWSDLQSRLVSCLSHPTMVWLGLISYPLYLWHWPLLVLARIELLREPAPYEIALIYIAAAALAAGTWHYLEKPIRARKSLVPAKLLFGSAAAVTCLAVAIGVGLRATQSSWDPPPAVARALAVADSTPWRASCFNWDRRSSDQLADCVIGDQQRPQFDFALWGDSHAAAVAVGVDAAARGLAQKGLQLTASNCPPLLQAQVVLAGAPTDCAARNEAAFDLLRQHRIRRVLLVGAWVQYLGDDDKVLRLDSAPDMAVNSAAGLHRALQETIDRLQAAGIEVVILGPVPHIGWRVPLVLAAYQWRGKALPDGPTLPEFMAKERKVMPALERLENGGATLVYPHQRLCRPTCIVHLDGEILYSDGEHLTAAGAELLRPMFVQALSSPVRGSTTK